MVESTSVADFVKILSRYKFTDKSSVPRLIVGVLTTTEDTGVAVRRLLPVGP